MIYVYLTLVLGIPCVMCGAFFGYLHCLSELRQDNKDESI